MNELKDKITAAHSKIFMFIHLILPSFFFKQDIEVGSLYKIVLDPGAF